MVSYPNSMEWFELALVFIAWVWAGYWLGRTFAHRKAKPKSDTNPRRSERSTFQQAQSNSGSIFRIEVTKQQPQCSEDERWNDNYDEPRCSVPQLVEKAIVFQGCSLVREGLVCCVGGFVRNIGEQRQNLFIGVFFFGLCDLGIAIVWNKSAWRVLDVVGHQLPSPVGLNGKRLQSWGETHLPALVDRSCRVKL